ncbi:MAG: aspartate/glutamate racemase family protein [Clostridia bacterium]|nr:aspartate/glutamate racemase family protein [Clostridia bacterium]
MLSADGAIGVLDSGVGGVSVLNALRLRLPFENYVYLSDSVNAPYGRKSSETVRKIVNGNAERLVFMGCKALVIACNTATAVAVR